ncbi:hypothetical protein [Nakamurella sp. PAMC28650]|uniref:hypothetical protein n=1 Tax=Nakamurella sp. PAMC28650 TaxID=2762325 RepID=UPI00164D7351|nr:hypothetical protein [Nakamurella sp. PAMC28650]QNK82089.1 hypothetical protein H7F38_04805 [Nakamurella sp. PAMC28650]
MSTPVNRPPADDQTGERYNPTDRVAAVDQTPAVDRYAPAADGSYAATSTWEEPIAVPAQGNRVSVQEPVIDAPARSYGEHAADLGIDHDSVITREKEQFGGMKFGSGFFGWVAAAGIAVILTSLLTAAGVALSLTSKTSTADIANQAAAGTGTAKTVGLVGAILLLVVLFVAYYCGGYVAARMARFNGAKQGLAVWLWGIVFAVVIFVLVKIAGDKYNILTNLNLPRIPVGEGNVTTTTIIAIAAIIIVTLGAALLGGLAGMRYHRKVDKVGLTV